MNTLKLDSSVSKDEAIKLINKFRLANKNKWYQVELQYAPYTYKMKCYNTWVQLNYQYEGGKLNYNNPSGMDMSAGQFKGYLQDVIV